LYQPSVQQVNIREFIGVCQQFLLLGEIKYIKTQHRRSADCYINYSILCTNPTKALHILIPMNSFTLYSAVCCTPQGAILRGCWYILWGGSTLYVLLTVHHSISV
jgi:hypothetical protein